MNKSYDVVIIGGGVVGCAIAWYLSHFDLQVLLLEKELDICCGVSKANTGILHARSYHAPSTLKGELHLRSLSLLDEAEKELGISFLRCGALTVAFSKEEEAYLCLLKERSRSSGEIVTPSEIKNFEPYLSDKVYAAFYDPETRVVSPFKLTVALAETALQNGVEFIFDAEVTAFEEEGKKLSLYAGGKKYTACFAVNCAGLSSSRLAWLCGDKIAAIKAYRGQYFVLDKMFAGYVKRVIYPVPSPESKGILVTPTPEGNILAGPNFEEADTTETTLQGLEEVAQGARRLVPSLPLENSITHFSGLRPTLPDRDFHIFFSQRFPGVLHLCGIESPGLTSCFGIATYVGDLLRSRGLRLVEKRNFEYRKPFPVFSELTDREREKLIAQDPDWGKIICRCEEVTLAEVKHALLFSPGARTLDSLKRRVRTQAGRCQGSFCGMHLPKIMMEVLGIDYRSLVKSGKRSWLLAGETKEVSFSA
ncbi:NAD(P)/FAD-dependent oxidoreductase [Atrimonas thermophila]|uniref:NAD(P)/FAD-dependent oxidoreductase n=1 Tax=Atrimonas thermophila TaxID=3064161 RepID=UPI00399CAFF8